RLIPAGLHPIVERQRKSPVRAAISAANVGRIAHSVMAFGSLTTNTPALRSTSLTSARAPLALKAVTVAPPPECRHDAGPSATNPSAGSCSARLVTSLS